MFKPAASEKSHEVQRILRHLVEERSTPAQHISAFGFKYDSAFWIAVKTDVERERLKGDEQFLARLNAVFVESGYLDIVEEIWNTEIKNPSLAYLKRPCIEIESQETVDRDYGGHWFYAMK